MKYKRITVDLQWVHIYVLLAFMLGMLTIGAFISIYNGFKSINSNEPMLSPVVPENLLVKTVYAAEIKKEDTRWWKMYQIIRFRESNYGTKGLAVTCKKKGMINDVGYLPVKGYCFKSEWDQENTVANWINKRANYDGLTEKELYCVWNGAGKTENCHYANGRLDLAN